MCVVYTLVFPSVIHLILLIVLFFFFNDTATTEIYTLSLHDALPISGERPIAACVRNPFLRGRLPTRVVVRNPFSRKNTRFFEDRKSTRLNSSHANISYAVFCLKKKKTKPISLFVFLIGSLSTLRPPL